MDSHLARRNSKLRFANQQELGTASRLQEPCGVEFTKALHKLANFLADEIEANLPILNDALY